MQRQPKKVDIFVRLINPLRIWERAYIGQPTKMLVNVQLSALKKASKNEQECYNYGPILEKRK